MASDSLLLDWNRGFGTTADDGRVSVKQLSLSWGGTGTSGGGTGTGSGFAAAAGTARALQIADEPDGAVRGIRLDPVLGDVDAAGTDYAPHQRPRWTLSGGGLAIEGSTGQWFLAPHARTASTKDALGLYFQAPGAEAVLVQTFAV